MAWRQWRSCGKSGACSWPPPGDLWGVLCLFQWSVKGNSSKLLVSLSYLTYGSVLIVSTGWTRFVLHLLAIETTECWSTQWGLACWQSCEHREKNLMSILCLIGFLPMIGHHILWLVYSQRGGIKIIYLSFTFRQTSCNKLFSVISFESMYYPC
jgi:hypothetical protein